MKRILFVCTGNTCRSPMAEYILKDKLNKKEIQAQVSSAGNHTWDGSPAAPLTVEVLSDNGLDISGFRSRQLTQEMIESADTVICMTRAQAKRLSAFNNIESILSLTGLPDVADPFGKEKAAYVKAYKELNAACERILDIIKW